MTNNPSKIFQNKRILITGACGTVGSELLRQLLDKKSYLISDVVGIDNNEGSLFFLEQEYLNDDRVKLFVVDIREQEELNKKMQGIDIVFHAAALKHVAMCERSPEQAVRTNIHGVQNIITSAFNNGVERVIFTSSDKAVNPTNVMGTSKLMGERLMTAANSNKREDGPVFASTRFGNILGSSGSVIPIFHNQIAQGGPVTLTDRKMTRFVMKISEAVRLVLDSAQQTHGGEVFVTKMPVVRIEDLAKVMINELAPSYGKDPDEIEIIEIGSKPGEKLYEELMSQEETRRAIELSDYFSILPAFRGIYNDINYEYPDTVEMSVTNPYISEFEHPLQMEQIKELLADSLQLKPDGQMIQRYWPGDKK